MATAPPSVVPLDPADLDRIPPADLDVCGVCRGHGDVPLGDPSNPGTAWHDCAGCRGTGSPIQHGGAA